MTGFSEDRVLVTGATGRVGRLVVDELLRSGVLVRAFTRSPERAGLPVGIEVVRGDLTVPASLDAALPGVATVFLVWTVPVASASEVIARMASGPPSHRRRIVYLSAPHRTQHPFFQQPNPLRQLHAEVERLLEDSGLDVAVIRPGMFASNARNWWGSQIARGDVVRWPYGDAATAPVDERDIAAVAARVLLDGTLANHDCVLTGPQSLTQAEQVQIIGNALERRIFFEELSPDEFRREIAASWPPAAADMLLGAWQAASGQPAFVTSSVHDILGAPPRSFHQWALDNRAAFARQ